jgi:hypothetical protein
VLLEDVVERLGFGVSALVVGARALVLVLVLVLGWPRKTCSPSQFDELWGDMSAIADLDCSFFVVPRSRGQQLKDPDQLDGWLRDGSAAHIESLCEWEGD